MTNQPLETQPQADMKNVKFTVEPRWVPRNIMVNNLDVKVLSAATKAAMEFNTQHGNNVVEVLSKSGTHLCDAGVDIEVRYNQALWKTPTDFLDDFKLALEQYCEQAG